MKKILLNYTQPVTKVYLLQTENIICFSAKDSTEQMDTGDDYDNDDFE